MGVGGDDGDGHQFFEVRLQSQAGIFTDYRILSVLLLGRKKFLFTLLGSFDWSNN